MPFKRRSHPASALTSWPSHSDQIQTQHKRSATPMATFATIPSTTDASGMTAGSYPVPQALKKIVFVARMGQLISLSHLVQILGSFTPPIDPESREWRALEADLDTYHHAIQTHIDLEMARAAVNVTANAVMRKVPDFVDSFNYATRTLCSSNSSSNSTGMR
ncbi:hypothetical protein MXD62_22425 [Frankia sp. Mgl5]|uniref:hypothetical protein n=1 Tax=Frankia sp. Mgl5 TaxID=2933793 RepID=UPI00201088EC|nr:hypothetical protein [Frankia sp. Mgl5]MCK9929888.1 hypothetical protein [Frankia sp. Mgl5]